MRSTYLAIITAVLLASIFILSYENEQTRYLDRIHHGLIHIRDQYGKDSLTDEKIASLDPLFVAIYEKEKEMEQTHYQMVSAQNTLFMAFQMILKEIYQTLEQQKYSDYEFIRIYDDLIYSSLDELFDAHPHLLETESDLPGDTNHAIGSQVISASLSLETCRKEESALYFFAMGSGLTASKESEGFVYSKLAQAILKEGITENLFGEPIQALISSRPRSEEGVIMQYFIPKETISNIAYAALDRGFVSHEENRNLSQFFEAYKKDQTQKNFNYFDKRQVRLLAGALNSENVKIYRYSTIPAEELNSYTQKVQSVVQEIFKKNKRDNYVTNKHLVPSKNISSRPH